MNFEIKLDDYSFSNSKKINIIAGPCVLESKGHAQMMVEKLLNITSKLNINFIYKTSYDKANRTSLDSERGIGIDQSIEIFQSLKEDYGIRILTDVHNSEAVSYTHLTLPTKA